jgi:hypothetical protein
VLLDNSMAMSEGASPWMICFCYWSRRCDGEGSLRREATASKVFVADLAPSFACIALIG